MKLIYNKLGRQCFKSVSLRLSVRVVKLCNSQNIRATKY